MNERQILFRDAMVRAIRAGDKTVTRRVGLDWSTVCPGRRLVVRECTAELDDGSVVYRADGPLDARPPNGLRWTPSLLMPRRRARMILEVVEVRAELGHCRWPDGTVELLPDVTDAEARLEGVADRAAFLALWARINGPALVDRIWRIAFRVLP